jgi:acyl-CoA thioester hydrolase
VSLTDETIRERNVWVVLDHYISYKSPAYIGEKIEVHTWVTMNKGVRSERQYRIIRSEDQQLLVEAKTTWCLLDAKSNRPVPISEEIINLFN